MRCIVLEGQPPDYPSRFRVGIGSPVSLPVVHHHESIGAYRQVLSALIEQIVKVEALRTGLFKESSTEIIAEPFDDRAGGNLTPFHHVLTRNHSVGEGAKEPWTVDGLRGRTENSVRRACDEGDLARSQHIHAHCTHHRIRPTFSNWNTRGQTKLLCRFLAETTDHGTHVQYLLGELLEKIVQSNSLIETGWKTVVVAVIVPAKAGGVDTRRPFASETVGHPINVFTNMCSSTIHVRFILFQPEGLAGHPFRRDFGEAIVFECRISSLGDSACLIGGTNIHPDDGWSQYSVVLIQRDNRAGRTV